MIDTKKVEKLTYELLLALGENPERDGLKDTPKRVSKMFGEFFGEDKERGADLAKVFEEDFESGSGIVEVRNIPFSSLCEHHMLPFRGVAHIKYLPDENFIIGLSKFSRIVAHFSKGLQVQERITSKVADFIFKNFPVRAVEVTLEAEHLCMTLRGTKAVGSSTKTVFTCGDFSKA